MNKEFSSEREYVANKRDDGRPVEFPSRNFYGGPTKLFTKDVPAEPPVADEELTQEQVDAERLHYEIDLALMHTLDDCQLYLKMMMRDGFAAMEEGDQSPACKGRESVEHVPNRQAEPSTPQPQPDDAAPPGGKTAGPIPGRCRPGSGAKPVGEPPEPRSVRCPGPAEGSTPRAEPGPRKLKNANAFVPPPSDDNTPSGQKAAIEAHVLIEVDKATRGQAPVSPDGANESPRPGQAKPLSRGQRINLGFMAVKQLQKVAAERAKIAHAITERAGKLSIRDRFMQDRAIALVYGLLLYLDKEWKTLGFGAWMPFRWPDQWLSFCGLLSRVLAANGLIHAKHADTYRRLLDETPPVELEGSVYDRAKEARTPHNMARCKSNQGAYTMSELKKRYANEIVKPKADLQAWIENEYVRYGHMNKPPDTA